MKFFSFDQRGAIGMVARQWGVVHGRFGVTLFYDRADYGRTWLRWWFCGRTRAGHLAVRLWRFGLGFKSHR